ncbi:hypothetical protein AB0L65_21070 [Nonomuraea sp. NPDC052116]|uniref:hypothetical protein n=1 Tax=Nonomuraea sp. NPDC052116 TaxID=3155665 RepID=UPI0034172CE5
MSPVREPSTDLALLKLRHNKALDKLEQDRADRELLERLKLARRGQWLGFASLMLILGTVVLLAMTGHDLVAAAVAVPGVIAIVGVFVTGQMKMPASLLPGRVNKSAAAQPATESATN